MSLNIAHLVDEGKLDYDEKVSKYWPEFTAGKQGRRYSRPTLRPQRWRQLARLGLDSDHRGEPDGQPRCSRKENCRSASQSRWYIEQMLLWFVCCLAKMAFMLRDMTKPVAKSMTTIPTGANNYGLAAPSNDPKMWTGETPSGYTMTNASSLGCLAGLMAMGGKLDGSSSSSPPRLLKRTRDMKALQGLLISLSAFRSCIPTADLRSRCLVFPCLCTFST
jgi:CubicO group peptidase (beta-lactamase class C family)